MSKKTDILTYYNRIQTMCCYRTTASSEIDNILQMAITFNQSLDDQFRINNHDTADFIAVYREYRGWLLERYISRYFYFSAICKNYLSVYYRLSPYYRKYINQKAFIQIYGGYSKEALFLAQTFSLFSEEIVNDESKKCPALLKMRLASLLMLDTIGDKRRSWEITDIKYELM